MEFWVIIFLICCTAIGFAVIKTVRFFFPKRKTVAVHNPYMAHENLKNLNNKWYDEYISYLNKNNPSSVPADKLRFAEEIKADNSIEQLKKRL